MLLVMDRKMVDGADKVQGLAGWLLALLSRANATWAQGKPARKHLRVVETMQLGGRRQLTLVSCDGERFLIGSGPDSVQTMTRVRPEAATVAASTVCGGGDR